MKKTNNFSPDKDACLDSIQKIKFDLNPQNYKCFISNSQKVGHNLDGAVPLPTSNDIQVQNVIDPQRRRVSDLRIPYIRRHSQMTSYGEFNAQVLLMQYNQKQVYTDSIKTQLQDLNDNKSINSQTSEQTQLIRSCLKMLGEQTDSQSSHPISAPIPSPYFYQPSRQSQNNAFSIDIQRITLDGRTTIMIRNIPNKYTQGLLLDLFNKNHKGEIDFFYLPIDFKNNCNVGYAFLNFIQPKFLKDFYQEFHNKKWKLFNSQKICQICYARIQGTTQLSHHFEFSKKFKDNLKP